MIAMLGRKLAVPRLVIQDCSAARCGNRRGVMVAIVHSIVVAVMDGVVMVLVLVAVEEAEQASALLLLVVMGRIVMSCRSWISRSLMNRRVLLVSRCRHIIPVAGLVICNSAGTNSPCRYDRRHCVISVACLMSILLTVQQALGLGLLPTGVDIIIAG